MLANQYADSLAVGGLQPAPGTHAKNGGAYSVKLRVADGDLVARMSAMRIWLDSHRFEPAAFRCRHIGGDVVIQVEFAGELEATAFAAEFAKKVMPR